jgi:hypothetical protein
VDAGAGSAYPRRQVVLAASGLVAFGAPDAQAPLSRRERCAMLDALADGAPDTPLTPSVLESRFDVALELVSAVKGTAPAGSR